MSRKVFFSFHHSGDIGRIGQVRNSWLTKGEDAGYVDEADWESIKRQGEGAVKKWIDTQLNGTSVTVVLIGNETASRPWVNYEIRESHKKKNGLLGIYIHNCKLVHEKMFPILKSTILIITLFELSKMYLNTLS